MKISARICFIILMVTPNIFAQDSAPTTAEPFDSEQTSAASQLAGARILGQNTDDIIKSQVASNAVSLIWEPSNEADQYMITIKPLAIYYAEGEVNPADIITTTTKDYQVIIGSLKPNTIYSCSVALADSNGTAFYYDYAYLTFKTLLAKVANLKVFYAGDDFIELTWDESENAIGYSVAVKDQHHNIYHADVVVVGTKATITGLEPVNYYFIYVTVLGADGDKGDTAIIQARTDGKGVKVQLWEGHDGDIHGGGVTIFRPMEVPPGPYAIKVNFGCSLASVKIWNAKFLPDDSDLDTGMVYMEQRKPWQKQKSMIGIIFYIDMYSERYDHCELTNTSITALYGEVASNAAGVESLPTESVDIGFASTASPFQISCFGIGSVVSNDCPIEVYEWRTTKTAVAESAGLIKVLLENIYNDTGVAQEDAKFPKPIEGHFVIAINSGEGCPGGIIVNRPWSMTQKSSAGMVGAIPSMSYFVQSNDQWYSNQPGLIYGYDPKNCPDRSGISVQIMVNGPFVRAVQLAEDVVPEPN